MDDFDILFFVVTADVVGFAYLAFAQHLVQRTGMVFDVEPITHLIALAIDRQRFAFEGVEDDQRDELFGKVVWAIVVGTVGDQHWQAISSLPGTNQMVGTGFTCRVRGAGRVRRGFGEELFRIFQIAIHLVGGDVMEAESCLARIVQALPIMASRFKQGIGADDVGFDECSRPGD